MAGAHAYTYPLVATDRNAVKSYNAIPYDVMVSRC
jgi:hypothetical protein